MKFGKVIQRIGEQLPDKHFLRYKQLKKLLKHAKGDEQACSSDKNDEQPSTQEPNPGDSKSDVGPLSPDTTGSKRPDTFPEETEFIKALNEELSSLNDYFMDEEEKVVIRLQALESELDQVQGTNNEKSLQKLKAAFIDFHGEIVMLLHWGILNYAAVAKILKKHDKQTGLPLRKQYLENVLRQPFYSTDLLQRLTKRVEEIVEQLVDPVDASTSLDTVKDKSSKEERNNDASVWDDKLRIAKLALGTWQELGDNASTPSTVLPVSRPIPGNMLSKLPVDDEKSEKSEKSEGKLVGRSESDSGAEVSRKSHKRKVVDTGGCVEGGRAQPRQRLSL